MIPYQEGTLEDAFQALNKEQYPLKAKVHELLRGHTLRVRMLAARIDENAFEAFKLYFDAHPCDIDSVMLFAQPLHECSLGAFYFMGPKGKGNSAYDRVLGSHVERYRSEPPFTVELREIMSKVIKGSAHLAELEAFVKNRSFNIDLIAWDNRNTIGEWLKIQQDLKKVELVEGLPNINAFRTYRVPELTYDERLRLLVNDALTDPNTFTILKAHYLKNPVDADGFVLDLRSGKTLGCILDEHAGDPQALRIAELMQAKRTNQVAHLRALFKQYEKDPKLLAAFNKWRNQFPCNLDEVPYDASQPQGETLGARVKKDRLLCEFFKRSPGKGSQDSWLSKNRTMVFLVAGFLTTALLLHLRNAKHKKQKEHEKHEERQALTVAGP